MFAEITDGYAIRGQCPRNAKLSLSTPSMSRALVPNRRKRKERQVIVAVVAGMGALVLVLLLYGSSLAGG